MSKPGVMRYLLLSLCLFALASTTSAQQVICERLYGTSNHLAAGYISAGGLYMPTADSILLVANQTYPMAPSGYTGRTTLHRLGRTQCDTARLAEIGRSDENTSIGYSRLTQTRRRDLLVFGQRYPNGTPADSPRLQVQAITRQGVIRWTRHHSSGGQYDEPTGILEAPDRGMYLSTYSFLPGTPNVQGVLYKLDSLGRLRWQRTYAHDRGNPFHFGAPVYTRRGTLLVAGTTRYTQVQVVEVGQHGDSLYSRVVMPARQNIYNIRQTSLRPLRDGGFLLAGLLDTLVSPFGITYPYLINLDANLNVRWSYIHRQGGAQGTSFFLISGYELTNGALCAVFSQYAGSSRVLEERFLQVSATGTLLTTDSFNTVLNLPPGEVMRPTHIEPLAADSSWVIIGTTPRMYVGHVRLPGLRAVVPLPPIPAAVPLPARPARAVPALAAYPNPARHTLTVPLPAGAGAGWLVATDALGRVVARQAVAAGAAAQVLAVAGWAPGLYGLTLQGAGGRVLGRQRVSVAPE